MAWLFTIFGWILKAVAAIKGPSAEERAGRDGERAKQLEAENAALKDAVKAASKPDMTIAELEAKANRGEL